MSREKILVPVDLEEDSSGLLRFAENIAKNIHGRISCVNVMSMQDNSTDISKNIETRRCIEMKLAKTTTESFSKNKPEFDIIVTKGDFEARLVTMVEELGIDLVVTQTQDPISIKKLHSVLCVPIVIFKGLEDNIRQLVLDLNLHEKYYYKIQSCIDIVTLLNAQIKVLTHSPAKIFENKYKETIDDIKLMIEKENIACSISFICEEDSKMAYFAYPTTTSALRLVSIEEYLSQIDKKQEDDEICSGVLIIPNKKKQVKYNHPIRELAHN